MSKETKRVDFRVIVKPRGPGDFGVAHMGGINRDPEKTEKICEEIAQQIRRHVDNLPSGGSFGSSNRGVRVTWDTEEFCEYCGAIWTEDDEDYNGGCCSLDQEKAS